jgi:dienelactone hydrolase
MAANCRWLTALTLLFYCPLMAVAQEPAATKADLDLSAYFRQQTAQLDDGWLSKLPSLEAWQAKRPQLELQLREMLGLHPWPVKNPLKAQVTGSVERDDFRVEKLHFQSRPGLYVTANLYLPKQIDKPVPVVLYVCGHGPVKKNGVSYGNKVSYQHHGAWFARHGIACLTIDTLQLGEIEGLHHGTYREGMWWWLNHGYTPAGVEAWNCVRALDYLETRPEIDATRMGVTGRSGGGAYSWWIAALDERIKAAVPVAGITDLEDHVVDGCVEGHCDCMYFVNTHGWDYATAAALIAPRPLLLANTDHDEIFPLAGVMRIYGKLRHVYDLYGAADKLGLNITPGGHNDTQDLQIPAFRWLAYHLKNGDTGIISDAAVPFFEPEELKVFEKLPDDQKNTRIQEEFVPLAGQAKLPQDLRDWERLRTGAMTLLREKSFRGWPREPGVPAAIELAAVSADGVRLTVYDLETQPSVDVRLIALAADQAGPVARATLQVADAEQWQNLLSALRVHFGEALPGETGTGQDVAAWNKLKAKLTEGQALLFLAPRGIGPSAWSGDERKQTQIQRRFYLLGQSLDGMRVFDIVQAVRALRSIERFREPPLTLTARRAMAGNALYASLFVDGVNRLRLIDLPGTHRDGPILLNVSQIWEMPQAVTAAMERMPVELVAHKLANPWAYPRSVETILQRPAPQLRITTLRTDESQE